MMNLDSCVDALEDEVAARGVLSLKLSQFAPARDRFHGTTSERMDILVELLRVWMEHRWRVGEPVSWQDCLNEFPHDQFRDVDRERLQFEERRLRNASHSQVSSSRSPSRPIEDLPNAGERWDDFELLGILGVGAFAKVYLARQLGMAGRLVALKLSFRATQESEWLATLQHSAIVPIYSRHKQDSIYGICMPYLGNTTLADVLHESPSSRMSTDHSSWWKSLRRSSSVRRNPMLSTIENRQRQIETIVESTGESLASNGQVKPESVRDTSVLERPKDKLSLDSSMWESLRRRSYVDSVLWIGSELADALSYAHRNGIIHSDIKPANVLLGSDGQPRLLDFNVAYQGSADGWIHNDMSLGGTIPYMSPEHRLAFSQPQSVDARSDIYSLGVVLFELLTGNMPNKEIALGDIPRDWNSDVSPATSAIVQKCLRSDPKARYSSARELCDDLRAQFQHMPLVHLAEPSLSERLVKWSSRHPRLSSMMSVVSIATVLIAALTVGIFSRDSALRRADWSHRIDVLRERIPNSMAMLTSLDAVPELESEVVRDLENLFDLIVVKDGDKKSIDPRWNQPIHSSSDVGDSELRASLLEMKWIAENRDWTRPPELPKVPTVEDGVHDLSGLYSLQLIRGKRFADAIPPLKQRVANNPRDYVGWWMLGGCYQASQDFNSAKQSYSICIALLPTTAIAYLNRGLSEYSMMQFEEAAADFQRSISIGKWAWPLLNRALALRKLGRIDEALADLDQALEQGYATVSVYRLRSELHLLKGDREAAVQDIKDAMQCVPSSEQHWIDRGLMQLAMAPTKAATDFESALKLNPDSIDAHQKLAYVYSELLRDSTKSLEHSDRLVALAPSQPTHLAGRAVLHARAGRVELAITDLRQLEQCNPREGLVMYQVACAYSILAEKYVQDSQEAIDCSKSGFRWLKKSIQSYPAVWTVLQTDPDTKWLRGQPEFQNIAQAAMTLEVIPK